RARNPFQFLHEFNESGVAFCGYDIPPGPECAGSFPESKRRTDTVAVSLFFANVGVQPRLKLTAQYPIHHLKREIVRCIPLRSRISECKSGLSGTRLVDQIDRGRSAFRCAWV